MNNYKHDIIQKIGTEYIIKYFLFFYIYILYLLIFLVSFFFSSTCTLKKSLSSVLSIWPLYQFEIFNPGRRHTQSLNSNKKNLGRENKETHSDKDNYFLLCF